MALSGYTEGLRQKSSRTTKLGDEDKFKKLHDQFALIEAGLISRGP